VGFFFSILTVFLCLHFSLFILVAFSGAISKQQDGSATISNRKFPYLLPSKHGLTFCSVAVVGKIRLVVRPTRGRKLKLAYWYLKFWDAILQTEKK
jgi:hypothetical protein